MDLISILYHAYLCHKNFIFSDPPRHLESFFIFCDPPHLCTLHYCCALEFPFHFYFLLFATHLTLALLDLGPDHFVLISLFLCAPAHPRSTHSCVPRLTPSEYHYNICLYELQCADSYPIVFGYPCSFSRGCYVRKFDKESQLFAPSSSMTYYHHLEIQTIYSQFLDIFFSMIPIQFSEKIIFCKNDILGALQYMCYI